MGVADDGGGGGEVEGVAEAEEDACVLLLLLVDEEEVEQEAWTVANRCTALFLSLCLVSTVICICAHRQSGSRRAPSTPRACSTGARPRA